MAAQAMAQFRFSPLSSHYRYHYQYNYHSTPSFPSPRRHPRNQRLHLSFSGGDRGGSGGGGGGGDSDGGGGDNEKNVGLGVVGMVLNGWRSRIVADPQFPFKVLMEELVGVSAAVAGDMATRPKFGLNELDLVFSTLVVGSILNFILMYLLAPTSCSSSSSTLPWIFARCPSSHMFEAGPYGSVERLGTLLYKGGVFALVGLGAGLVGTAISNGLIATRKKVDPTFQSPNKSPPMVLNAFTWAAHMGVSSNVRYQTLNGVEFLLDKWLPPLLFKFSVLALRFINNVAGGMTFVMLARFTGSQAAAAAAVPVPVPVPKHS